MQKDSYNFTVFTSTYNRGELLKNIFKGLSSQLFKNFEWIIIDDGSTDNTREVVNGFLLESTFTIKYFYQENSGKHIACIRALEMAEGLFFLPLDSDDVPLPNALFDLNEAYFSIPENERGSFSAVTGLCIDKGTGNVIGDSFPEDVFDSTPLDLFYKYKISGDKWGFQLTEIRRKYTYPIKPDDRFKEVMKFYPEIAIFGEIGKIYKTRYINKILKVVEYQQSGLSKSKVRHAYPKKISALYRLNYCSEYFKYDPLEFIVTVLLYNRWSLHSSTLSIGEIKNYFFRILAIIFFPMSFIIYLTDKVRYK